MDANVLEYSAFVQPRTIRITPHKSGSKVDVFDSRGWLFADGEPPPSRNWGLEHRSSTGHVLADDHRAVLSVFDKHLHRGRRILLDADLEQYILENRGDLTADFGGITDSFNPAAFQFGSDEERAFWEVLEQQVGNPSRYATPQFPLVALTLNSSDEHRRVDFLLDTTEGMRVIEIDGAHHEDERQMGIDEERDLHLSHAGYKTVRIPTRALAAGAIPVSVANLKSNITPEQLAHVVSVAVCRAITLGVLPLTNGSWQIAIHLPAASSLAIEFFSQAVNGTLRHLSHLFTLYNIKHDFPEHISVKVGEQKRPVFGSDNRASGEPACLNLHFDKVPNVELGEGHFYYRELPTDFPVMATLFDARPTNLHPDHDACLYFLRYFFRFASFREGQWEGLQRALMGLDSLVLMPTGHGKSLIYQLAALLRVGVCLVVDPIIALMEDQVENMGRWGITRAASISAEIAGEGGQQAILDALSQAQLIFCLIAPERLQIPKFRNALRTLTTHTPISLVVIDEAHCVSEWGHDFRTAYLQIGRSSRRFCTSKGVTPPLMGLTGTASRSVLKDVRRALNILDFDAVITPKTFDRPELKYRIELCTSKEKPFRLRGLLQALPINFGHAFDEFFSPRGHTTTSGLVFCSAVGGNFGVVDVASTINAGLQIKTSFYGGKVPKGFTKDSWISTKRGAASSFMKNQTPLMVATSAFGMGVDKPNIRYTIHYGIPRSIETFYQEAGRAGRNRDQALCIILASNDWPQQATRLLSDITSISQVADEIASIGFSERADDITRQLYFHTNGFSGIEKEKAQIAKVLDLVQDLEGEGTVTIKAGNELNVFEKAVHRLVIIGFIQGYEMDYNNRLITAELAGATSEFLSEELLKYVANYQRSRAAAFEERMPDPDQPLRSYLLQIVTLLLVFIYDTIELGRRRALLEMVELCAPNATDAAIRNRIARYLERGEFDEQLEVIVDDIGAQDVVSEVLEDIVSPRHAESLRGQVVRFLESYPDHPNLLLLRGTVECLCGDGNPDIVTTSLENWAISATTKYSVPLDRMSASYSLAMVRITERMPDVAAEVSRTILLKSTNREFLRHVLKESGNDVERTYALTSLLGMSKDRLLDASEIFAEKAR